MDNPARFFAGDTTEDAGGDRDYNSPTGSYLF